MINLDYNTINKIYFANLRNALKSDLVIPTEYKNNFNIDVKMDLIPLLSIHNILTKFILAGSLSKLNKDEFNSKLQIRCEKDAKKILEFVNLSLSNFTQEKGDAKVLEYKNCLISEIYKTLEEIENQNYISKDRDYQSEADKEA